MPDEHLSLTDELGRKPDHLSRPWHRLLDLQVSLIGRWAEWGHDRQAEVKLQGLTLVEVKAGNVLAAGVLRAKDDDARVNQSLLAVHDLHCVRGQARHPSGQ